MCCLFPQLDAQLADMDSHREKALAAVAKGNSVLQDAANTLRTLKGKRRCCLGPVLLSFLRP
jgi:hypothetical protein